MKNEDLPKIFIGGVINKIDTDLRDRMAIAAMQGILSAFCYPSSDDLKSTAESAYRLADIMLKVRGTA